MNVLSETGELVRKFDNDRFLTALFAPEKVREDLFNLYAFNLELAKVRETVSEPLIGRMRLQFWRDAISGLCDGNPPSHNVAEAFSLTVNKHDLSADELEILINSREVDIDVVPPRDLPALVEYAEQSSATLMRLAVRCLGVDADEYKAFLRHAGIAVALAGLVRSIPFQVSTGFVTLPGDLCAAAGLDPRQPQQWPQSPDISGIANPVIDEATKHLEEARRHSTGFPRAGISAVLPLSLAARSLKNLRRVNGDPAKLITGDRGVGRHLSLLACSLLGKV